MLKIQISKQTKWHKEFTWQAVRELAVTNDKSTEQPWDTGRHIATVSEIRCDDDTDKLSQMTTNWTAGSVVFTL